MATTKSNFLSAFGYFWNNWAAQQNLVVVINKEFTVSKEYAKQLQQKKWIFEETTKTKKWTMLTLITTFGLKQNEHSLGLIEKDLTLDDLFG